MCTTSQTSAHLPWGVAGAPQRAHQRAGRGAHHAPDGEPRLLNRLQEPVDAGDVGAGQVMWRTWVHAQGRYQGPSLGHPTKAGTSRAAGRQFRLRQCCSRSGSTRRSSSAPAVCRKGQEAAAEHDIVALLLLPLLVLAGSAGGRSRACNKGAQVRRLSQPSPCGGPAAQHSDLAAPNSAAPPARALHWRGLRGAAHGLWAPDAAAVKQLAIWPRGLGSLSLAPALRSQSLAAGPSVCVRLGLKHSNGEGRGLPLRYYAERSELCAQRSVQRRASLSFSAEQIAFHLNCHVHRRSCLTDQSTFDTSTINSADYSSHRAGGRSAGREVMEAKRKADEVDGEANGADAAKKQRMDNGAGAAAKPKPAIDLAKLQKAKLALQKQKELAEKLKKAGIKVREAPLRQGRGGRWRVRLLGWRGTGGNGRLLLPLANPGLPMRGPRRFLVLNSACAAPAAA